MTRILISADMEGTCGVVNWVQVIPPDIAGPGRASSTTEYERARLRMTHEVNAAADGAFTAGADEVIVNDSHDGMRNLVPDELDPRVRFVAGADKDLSMMQGIDEPGISAVFFTGYHARAGTPDGPLAHSFTNWVHDIRVNGVSMGEYGINAIVAGHFDIPVALVTGDDRAVEQTRELLGEQVAGVGVKTGYSVSAAMNHHPETARQMIRSSAEQAVRGLEKMRPYRMPEGATVEMDLDHQSRVNQAIRIPGVTRAGWRSLSFQPTDAVELSHYLRAVLGIAGQVRD